MGLSPQSGIAGRMLAGVIASVIGTLACSQAWAQSNSDAASQGDAPRLKIDEAKRYFVRFGYVGMKPNTKSGEVKDASGYVATRDEIIRYGEYISELQNRVGDPAANALGISLQSNLTQAGAVTGYDIYADASGPQSVPLTVPSTSGMYADGLTALGIPRGITVEAKSAGTSAISLGYFLDEDQKWAVEGFVLAVPLKNDVYARQRVANARVAGNFVNRPGYLDGKKAMTTQVLPPLVMLTRYFGAKDATWRPSVGVGAAYAIFFDSKVPQLVSDYSGGKTTVSLKNSFGVGGFAGLQYRIDERWHVNATLGYLKLKTTGTLTTETTRFTSSSPALADVGGYTGAAITQGNTSKQVAVNKMLVDLANWKNGGTSGNYGRFVRTLDTQLDPYILWISAGYAF